MALSLYDRVKVNTTTTGNGSITLGTAVSGFRTLFDAGVATGSNIDYVIEDGNNWEIGTGTYTFTGNTLTRTVTSSSNSNTALTLSGSASVFISITARAANEIAKKPLAFSIIYGR